VEVSSPRVDLLDDLEHSLDEGFLNVSANAFKAALLVAVPIAYPVYVVERPVVEAKGDRSRRKRRS